MISPEISLWVIKKINNSAAPRQLQMAPIVLLAVIYRVDGSESPMERFTQE
jgi:hypothetical protein